MTGDELRAVEFRAAFRGFDPKQVDAALEDLATRLDAGRLQRAVTNRRIRHHGAEAADGRAR